jgi:hypothetical protein
VVLPCRDEAELEAASREFLEGRRLKLKDPDYGVLLEICSEQHLEEFPPVRARLGATVDRSTQTEPAPVQARPANGLTISQLYAAWAAEAKPSLKMIAEWKTILRRLQECLGGDVAVRSTGRDQMVAFKDSPLQIPRVISGKLKNLTVPEILQATAGQEIDRISNTSVNKALGLSAALFAWGVENSKLEKNPAAGVKATVRKVRCRRLPYDRNDIGAVFAMPVFRGTDGGPRYWLPVLGAWTGARLEELGQLRTADVRDQDGIAFLVIDPFEDEGSVKTEPAAAWCRSIRSWSGSGSSTMSSSAGRPGRSNCSTLIGTTVGSSHRPFRNGGAAKLGRWCRIPGRHSIRSGIYSRTGPGPRSAMKNCGTS